ncbi:hypothetical protein KSP39_PZI002941 [Platanthera zijinensis]|uniref:Uncharacterized protein n=1 Tax=Platanthera zijinensis TaxID=2320716 RepID=A0AAP0BY05_9ASPA
MLGCVHANTYMEENHSIDEDGDGDHTDVSRYQRLEWSSPNSIAHGRIRIGDYFVMKSVVLIMSLFVFFTTTMSVSFTLRETQSRMLKFTVQLQHHARHQLPTFQLIFVHVIESLVFVPIMIGILFFLFEFYDDLLLAFLCPDINLDAVFPPIFLALFSGVPYLLLLICLWYVLLDCFSYLAFSATAAFMQHLILYFWNRFEVPALQRFMRTRGQLQHQAGVQITSSTIYTSTLHIARVNVRNTSIGGIDGIQATGQAAPDPLAQPENTTASEQLALHDAPDAANNRVPFPGINAQQTGTAPGSSFLNPFSSFLLWILGGGASDGIVSFFSMFRDVRDHDQDFIHPAQPENDQARQHRED